MAYGLDATDLIYTDQNFVDIGTLMSYSMDIDISNQKDFTLTVDDYLIDLDCLVYVNGTEFGGIIDGFDSDPDNYQIIYKGRSFRGILDSKYIIAKLDPDYNDDLDIGQNVDGDITAVINQLLTENGLTNLFVCDIPEIQVENGVVADIHTDIGSYTILSGTSVYYAIFDLCYSIEMTFDLRFSSRDRKIHIIPTPIEDRSQEIIFSEEATSTFKSSVKPGLPNHFVATGLDEDNNTKTIHIFTDQDGNIQKYAKDGKELYTKNSPQQDSDYIKNTSQKVVDGAKEIMEYMELSPSPIQNFIKVGSIGDPAPSDWKTNFGYYYTKKKSKTYNFDISGHELEKRTVNGVQVTVEDFKLTKKKSYKELIRKRKTVNGKRKTVYETVTKTKTIISPNYHGFISKKFVKKRVKVKPKKWKTVRVPKAYVKTIFSFSSVSPIDRFTQAPYVKYRYKYKTTKTITVKNKKTGQKTTKKITSVKWSKYKKLKLKKNKPNKLGLYYVLYPTVDGATTVSIKYKNKANRLKPKNIKKRYSYEFSLYCGKAIVETPVESVSYSYEPVQAKSVGEYRVLNSKPARWASKYSSYFVISHDTSDPQVNRYNSVSGISKIDYKNWKKKWKRLYKKPKDFSLNYSQYYYLYEDGLSTKGHIKGKEVQAYSGRSIVKYKKLKTKPSDWKKNYSSYYEYRKKNDKSKKKSYCSVEGAGKKKNKTPTFKKNKYYLKETKTVPPKFKKPSYIPKTITVAPAFKPGVYYQYISVVTAPDYNKKKQYYKQVIDNYAEMVKSVLDQIYNYYTSEEQSIKLTNTAGDLRIGDSVGGKDRMTGQTIIAPVTNIIYKINNGIVETEYAVGGEM